MDIEKEMLTRHITSMERRIKALDGISSGNTHTNGGDIDQLSLKLDEVKEEVHPPPSELTNS
jgi:hypothetical protein